MRGFDSCYPCYLSYVRKRPRRNSYLRKKLRFNGKNRTYISVKLFRAQPSLATLFSKLPTSYTTKRTLNYYSKVMGLRKRRQTVPSSSRPQARSTGPTNYSGWLSLYNNPSHPRFFGSRDYEDTNLLAAQTSRYLLITLLGSVSSHNISLQFYRKRHLLRLASSFANASGVLQSTVRYSTSNQATIDSGSFPHRLLLQDLYFIKFFLNKFNLLTTTRRLAMPIVARRSIWGNASLSVDTFSTNYFSYKIYLSAPTAYTSLVSYATKIGSSSSISGFLPRNYLSLRRRDLAPLGYRSFNTSFSRSRYYKSKRAFYTLSNSKYARPFRLRRLSGFARRLYRLGRKNANHVNSIMAKYSQSLSYNIRTLPQACFSTSPFADTSRIKLKTFSNKLYAGKRLTASNKHNFSKKIVGVADYLLSYQLLLNPFLSKLNNNSLSESCTFANYKNLHNRVSFAYSDNITPSTSFRKKVTKNMKRYVTSSILNINLTPWYCNTLVRFFEQCSGKKTLLQYYLSVSSHVDESSVALYKTWVPRLSSYERKLGHKFFLEEALHIIHLGFRLHDSSLVSNWLKAIIKRISFWKTRSIFRFLRYLFNNYVQSNFDYLGIKGFKIRLKGKISAAGNSRKRNIIFRSGLTSYSAVNLKCVHTFSTITTFTGVMGFQVWIFY